jgi:hypothetical protein
MIKNTWITLAPGVRVCYRAGSVHLECFGVQSGIKQGTVEPVSIAEDYLPEDSASDTWLLSRDQYLTNDKGVMVAISFYSKESQVDKDRRNASLISEDDLEFLHSITGKSSSEDRARAKSISSRIKSQHSTKRKCDKRSLDFLAILDLDIERVLADSRGEKGPNTVGEVVSLMEKVLDGELSTEQATKLATESNSKPSKLN